MPKLVPGYKDEVKEKILETAWAVVTEKGMNETTMDDFASAMNCSKGALYNYFRTKEELVEAVINKHHIRAREELFARFSEGDFFVNAEKFFDVEMENALEHMGVTLELHAEGTRNARVADALKRKNEVSIKSFRDLVEYLQQKGTISLKTDPEEAAKLFHTLRMGVLLGITSGLSKSDAKKIWIDGLKGIVSVK